MVTIDDRTQEMLFSGLVLRNKIKDKLHVNKEPLLEKDIQNSLWSVEQRLLKVLEKIIYESIK